MKWYPAVGCGLFSLKFQFFQSFTVVSHYSIIRLFGLFEFFISALVSSTLKMNIPQTSLGYYVFTLGLWPF